MKQSTALTLVSIAILIAVILIGTRGWSQTVGLKFPMRVVNPVTNEPVTGAWIYASAWEARPPVKVGGSATETSGGFYYFVLGSCDSCVTSDYYDLWVNNTLDSTRAGIPIGPGGLVLSCDMINTCHIIDDEVLLDEDMENNYGTDSTETGNVFLIDYETKHDANTAAAPIAITVVDHGTGMTQSMVAALDILHTVTGKNDDYNSPRGVAVSLVTDPNYPTETSDFARTGPVGYVSRVRAAEGGWGMINRVTSGSGGSYFQQPYYTAGGVFNFVDVDSLGNWWTTSSGTAYGSKDEVNARAVRNVIGHSIVTDTDSSVYNTTGQEIVVDGGWPGYSPYVIGTDTYVHGSYYVNGHQIEAWGLGNGAYTYGLTIDAMQDTSEFDGGALVTGVWADASRQDWGQPGAGQKKGQGTYSRARGDSCYGVIGLAQSDEDHASHYAIGVYGAGGMGRTNYGVKGEAVYVDGTVTNYGVYGKASGGATNYAGYFDGPVYMSAGQQVEDLTVGTLTMDDTGSDAVTGMAQISANSDTVRVTADDATSSGACTIILTPVGRFPDQGDSLKVDRITGGAFTIYAGWQTANQDYYWMLVKR